VKGRFGTGAGRVTGLYTAALAAGAAMTAALTAPVAQLWGWRAALAVWAVPALVAAAVWSVADRSAGPGTPMARGDAGQHDVAVPSVWRHPVAWATGLLLALQTMLYYAATTWLPTVLVDQLSASLSTGAAAATLYQLVGIGGALLVPALVGRWRGQVGFGLVVGAGWVAFFAGLLAWPAGWVLWVVVGGLAQGAGVALAFTVVVLRAHDEAAARQLSGMVQLVGYGIGATGPLVAGGLYGATGSWLVPLGTLSALGVCYALVGAAAGRPVTVGGPAAAALRGAPAATRTGDPR
jgi:CP family cyanate transporter-like MFS transporter